MSGIGGWHITYEVELEDEITVEVELEDVTLRIEDCVTLNVELEGDVTLTQSEFWDGMVNPFSSTAVVSTILFIINVRVFWSSSKFLETSTFKSWYCFTCKKTLIFNKVNNTVPNIIKTTFVSKVLVFKQIKNYSTTISNDRLWVHTGVPYSVGERKSS